MGTKIYYKKEAIDTIDELFTKFSSKEFKSPFRSTIPLLVLYKNHPDNYFGLVEHDDEASAKYIFEFETKIEKGKGRSSCTDLMIEYSNTCIAIEAKRTEPAYKTVIDWLGGSNNRKLVLEGWLDLIFNYTGIKLDPASISNLPYQLIHRTASACSLKKAQTHIVYLGFDLNEAKNKYYNDILTAFSTILENMISFHLACFKIEKLPEQIRLESMWNNKKRNLSEYIIRGLKSDSLMKVSQLTMEKLNKCD